MLNTSNFFFNSIELNVIRSIYDNINVIISIYDNIIITKTTNHILDYIYYSFMVVSIISILYILYKSKNE